MYLPKPQSSVNRTPVLAGKNNLAITGEVNFFEKTRFDAKQLWLDPYLIIVGPFVKW
jgi:hypothetical protein